jgi:hypothetical protein
MIIWENQSKEWQNTAIAKMKLQREIDNLLDLEYTAYYFHVSISVLYDIFLDWDSSFYAAIPND